MTTMKALVLSVLSGLLLTAGFPKPAMFYVAWVAFVPLFFAVEGKSAMRAFALGYLCGFIHSLTNLFWIYHAVAYFSGLPTVISILILMLLCCLMGAYFAVFAVVAVRWERLPLLYVFGLPFVWVALEWVRAHAISGFPWANMGYTQTPLNHLIQFTDITGVYGPSWLVVFGSTTVYGFIRNFSRKLSVAVLAVCIVGALVYGYHRTQLIDAAEDRAATISVGIVQGNIRQNEKWDPAFEDETIKRYAKLTGECVKGEADPDILVWPESAMPFLYGVDEKQSLEVERIVKESGKPLLFGSIGVTRRGGTPHLLNKAYLLDEEGLIKGAYSKQHLVPFGEYVPYSDLLFFVHHIAGGQVDFVSGDSPGPVIFKGLPMGVLICYEAIFPEIARETVRRGAMVLMNITNDAWYGDTGGPYQHLEIARWRAIEFRVPLVRAANTGISAVFDSTGRECARLPLDTGGFLTCRVHPMSYLSFYAKYGQVFVWFCFFTAVIALIAEIIYTKISRRTSQ